MADELDFESRTEPASPRRREEAAEQGRFAVSTELNTGVVLIIGFTALAFFAHTLGSGLLRQTRIDLVTIAGGEMTHERVQHLLGGAFSRAMLIVGGLLGSLFVAAIVTNVIQVGFRMSAARLTLDFDRVAPKLDRFLSWSKSVNGLMLLLKLLAVTAVAWWILRQRGGEVAHIGDANLATAAERSWDLILRLALGMAGTLLAIGLIDYGWKYWQFERSIRMTKQEVKDEAKREEGNPLVKGRMRKMQRENAQRKMFRDIPKATVVVTNPTHLAVALRYESGMRAPKVVGKGAGFIAKRIVRLARQHNVPVLERKPLAQALFKTVKIDKEIPLALYVVVAELLAHVYRLKQGKQ